jgi:hypothetical protein
MRWCAILAVFLLLGAAPASAQYAPPEYAPSAYARNDGPYAAPGRVQPLDRILPGVRHSRPGTFYDAEGPYPGPDGRMHYRLKWMTPEGRIIWLDTDAHSGRVLGEARGERRPAWEGAPDRRRFVPRGGDRENWRKDWHERPPRRFERDRAPWRGHDWPGGNGHR